MKFGYEDLEVWNKAVDFAVQVIEAVERISTDRKHYRLLEQIESSSTSVSMNLAEGKGLYSKKEFIHFLNIALGSSYECVPLLEISKRQNYLHNKFFNAFMDDLHKISAKVSALKASLKK